LREQFQAAPWTSQFSADETPAADGQDGGLAQIELAARFLKFAAEQHPSHDQALDTVGVVSLLFDDFCDHFMKGNDIHVVTADLLLPARKVVINAYFTALVALQRSGSFSHSVAQKPVDSALFRHSKDGRVKLFAVFGGQGNIEDYFEETKEVFDIYRPLVYDFVVAISDHLSSLARIFDFQSTLTKGLDIMHWLTTPDTKPDLQYLISAPVSLPVIGFTQLLHLLVLAKVLGIQPGDVAAQFQGATGHSQGIVSSVVLATSTDYDSYLNNSKRALSLLFAIGNRAQQVFPQTVLNPSILEDSVSNSEGNPSPMLAVSNLRINEVTKHVEATNSHLPEDRKIEISLHNGPRSYVCCGPPQSLYGLNLALRKLKAPSGADQGRVPHSQRKLKFTSRFLPITAPFHSKYLAAAPPLILDDAKRLCCLFDSSELRLPVFSTADGSDLRAINGDITASIINMICLQPVNWPLATAMEGLTHIADFGPAGLSGVGRLTHRNKEGTGVRVILAGALEGVGPELSDKGGLFDTRDSAVHLASNWARDFAPRLVRTTCDGRIHIDSPMSRLLGKPTVMVAGMTPSTISEKFVAATMNAGYHIELSGGGHFTAQMLRDKVDKIMALVSPGLGVTLNSIYINPAQWNMQFPLIQQMRREGIPMEGLCIGAGVPTLDVANEIVQSLQSVGIAHIGFKPGTVGAIRQVIAIAQNNPTMSIILEWTGGRAGGHHSFEDFHQPILETYGAIRNQPNIVLVAGSGFGGVEDTVPYLTGEWSVKFDCAPMPFDGILFGSRVMVAKEGQADDAVKQAIVDAPGVDDADWEKTYKGPTGGIVTVNSELGEPIHKIATRGVMLWKEFDDTIFSLPRDKRLAVINAKKDYIIRRLNADFQKPYFGRKLDGTAVDVDRMTYAEVVYRLVDLMYIARQKRWIDVTLRDFVGDFLRRVEERFSDSVHESLLKSYDELQDPTGTVERVLDAYPESRVQLLTTEDVDFFVNLCRRPFQKPVPFIPLLDKEFDFWFKKDSLWQSEDLDAVIDSDVGRVCILQGPVAVRHSTKMNVPIKEMLDEIYEGQIRALKERYYDSDDSKVPAVPYLGARPTTTGSRQPEKTRVYIVPNSPSSGSPSIDTDKWLNTIAGPEFSWLRALLTSDIVVQGKRFVSNMAKRVLRPRPGQRVTVELDAETGEPAQLAIDDKDGLRAVEVRITSNNIILFTINHVADGRVCPLELQFRYVPEKPFALIHEIMEGSNDRVKEFYLKVWFGDKVSRDIIKIDDMHYQFTYRGQTVDRKDIIKFCQTVGNQSERYVDREQEFVYAPMDFAIRVGWIPIIQAIFPKFLDGDILKLVHLSNGFRMVDGAEPLRSGDVVDTVVQITGITNLPSGKRVNVKGELLRDGKPVIEVKSAFLYRGDFRDYDLTFQTTEETPIQVTYATSKDIAVLKSKEWFIPHEHTQHELVPGSKLVFRLETTATFRDAETYSHITTKGKVMMQVSTKAYEEIAVVDYECGESRGNPVIEYLTRVGHPIEQAHYFESGGYSVMPSSNQLSS
ncbi:fatty acid synthase alpha subunit Lsd1, partial [Spiromyces aspiralis]